MSLIKVDLRLTTLRVLGHSSMVRHQQSIAPAHDAASLLGALPDVALVLDAMGRIDFASAGSELYLGLRPRDWVGLSALDHLHADNTAEFVERLKLSQLGIETPTQALPVRIATSGGTWRSVAAHGFVQIDVNGLVGTLVMYRDLPCSDATCGLQRETSHRSALETVFGRPQAMLDVDRDDHAWITAELLPRVLNNPDPNGPLVAVVVMTLEMASSPGPDETLANPVGALAQTLRQRLRPGDILARLGRTQLVILCTGFGNTEDGLDVARRLHRWCSATSGAAGPSGWLPFTTSCVFASAGDNAHDVLAYATSPAGQIECGQFLSVAA